METHHNGAINMSFDYLDRSHDPVVKHFAQEIISSQSQELAAMNSYLNQAGGADGRRRRIGGDGVDGPPRAARRHARHADEGRARASSTSRPASRPTTSSPTS